MDGWKRGLFWSVLVVLASGLQVGWSMADVDLIELNEAFAAQVLADGKLCSETVAAQKLYPDAARAMAYVTAKAVDEKADSVPSG